MAKRAAVGQDEVAGIAEIGQRQHADRKPRPSSPTRREAVPTRPEAEGAMPVRRRRLRSLDRLGLCRIERLEGMGLGQGGP